VIGEEVDWTDENVNMILTIHNLADAYKLLPSEVLSKGNTFDLYVLDVYTKYLNYRDAKEQGKAPPSQKNYSVEELMAMRQRVIDEEAKKRSDVDGH
jgi:hypothetical protein